jgi:hypothetical protein
MTDAGGSDNLGALSDAAWDDGLLAVPGAGSQWTTAELRRHLASGQPVVAFVGSNGLPGHPPGEDVGEQPLLLIGTTPTGFVYSDPTFASSLGYGLQISERDLLSAWDGATRPRQALAFVPRPRPPARPAHVAEANPPEAIARVVVTPTPIPVVRSATQPPTPTPPPPTLVAAVGVAPLAVAANERADALIAASQQPAADWSWTVLLGLAAISVGTVAVRVWRARRQP